MGFPTNWLDEAVMMAPKRGRHHKATMRRRATLEGSDATERSTGGRDLTDYAQAWATPSGAEGGHTRRGGERGGELLTSGEAKQYAMALPRGWRHCWPVVVGMPNRAAACRLVGNSIVPQIAYAIFKAIETVER